MNLLTALEGLVETIHAAQNSAQNSAKNGGVNYDGVNHDDADCGSAGSIDTGPPARVMLAGFLLFALAAVDCVGALIAVCSLF